MKPGRSFCSTSSLLFKRLLLALHPRLRSIKTLCDSKQINPEAFDEAFGLRRSERRDESGTRRKTLTCRFEIDSYAIGPEWNADAFTAALPLSRSSEDFGARA
jgi:hypothetical protein